MTDEEFRAAAKVVATRERVLQSLGKLAAAPLDEDVTAEMQEVLSEASSPEVREAIARMSHRPERPQLRIVPTEGGAA